MKITILTLGTRGDVQPYIALALALQHEGYIPTIAAPLNFESLIRGCGVAYAPIRMDTEEGLRSREGRAWLASGNTRAFLRHLNALMERDRPALQKGCWEACGDADAIIATAMTLGEGITLSEKRHCPLLASLIYPILPAAGPTHSFWLPQITCHSAGLTTSLTSCSKERTQPRRRT
jgi:sterol 3beta-glucosyltransferase